MAASILSILAILAAFVWWLIRREADPTEQHRDRYDEIDKDIGSHNGTDSAVHGVDDLDELDRLQKR